ncbi:MAG TPA: signal peptidase II [Actinomycetota bacterium]|nr:signal peptidase II [Actinomycetota bacterium]
MREADREGQDQGPAVRHALHQGQAGRGAGGLRARRALILYGIAALVYALDRITKVLAEDRLGGRSPIELIPGVLDLRYTTNPGGAFGLFGRLSWLFVAVSVVVVVVVIVASRNLPSVGVAAGLGLVLGGAVGNLTDRAIRGPGFSGEVVDFIDLQVWPVFNLADTAIVLGAIILLVAGFRSDRAASTADR